MCLVVRIIGARSTTRALVSSSPLESGWSTFDGATCHLNDSESALPFAGWSSRFTPTEDMGGGGLGWL